MIFLAFMMVLMPIVIAILGTSAIFGNSCEFASLVLFPPQGPATQALETHDVRWEWPIRQPVAMVTVRCGSRVLAQVAPMPAPQLRIWHRRGVAHSQGYGLTEASPNVLCQADEDATRMGDLVEQATGAGSRVVDLVDVGSELAATRRHAADGLAGTDPGGGTGGVDQELLDLWRGRRLGRGPDLVEVLVEQAKTSLDIADACLARIAELPAGPVNVRLPKIVKAPEGSTYVWTENPLGLNGYYLVSRGEKTPWRLKLRTASFNNIAVLPEIVGGCVVADLVAILGSMFFVVGDIDK